MHRDKSSWTALEVSRYVLYAARNPRMAAVMAPGSAELLEKILLARSLVTPRQLGRMARPWLRRLLRVLAAVTLAGHPLHLSLRKRYFADAVDRAIEAGSTQLLVIGGGFDPLAVLTARRCPHVRVVEIDHPATQDEKRRALESLGETPPNLTLLPVELARHPLGEALEHCRSWDASQKAVVAAEGVLMYLPEADVRELFATLAAASDEGSRFIFSFLRVDAAGFPSFGKFDKLIRRRLARRGEPVVWGIAPEDLRRFVQDLGFDLAELVDPDRLRELYLSGTDLAQEPLSGIELFAVTELGA